MNSNSLVNNTLTLERFQDLIKGHENTFFFIKFIKRSDGSRRSFTCRLGRAVKKGLKGGQAAYNPSSHNLVWVYTPSDPKKPRKSIPLEGVYEISLAGKVYRFTPSYSAEGVAA